MKVEYSRTPYTKINSNQMKDLHLRTDTLKTHEENIGRTRSDISLSRFFSDPSLRVMNKKTKINKWDLMQLKAFAQQRKPETKRKDNPQNGNKYLQTKMPKRN